MHALLRKRQDSNLHSTGLDSLARYCATITPRFHDGRDRMGFEPMIPLATVTRTVWTSVRVAIMGVTIRPLWQRPRPNGTDRSRTYNARRRLVYSQMHYHCATVPYASGVVRKREESNPLSVTAPLFSRQLPTVRRRFQDEYSTSREEVQL